MSAQEEAVAATGRTLQRLSIPYMIVGGIANIVWGEPRATLDVDVTVWVEDAAIDGLVRNLAKEFQVLVPDPRQFVRDTRVLPMEARGGVRIDVILGLLPFEREAIARAADVRLGGALVKVCTAEDLILMKIVSERDRDLADARGVAARRAAKLDLAYLEPRIAEIARLLGRPEIEQRWKEWKP